MDYNDFENLLGQHISVFEKAIDSGFENEFFGKNFYYISDESIYKDFYGISYKSISVLTDENDKTQSIKIHLSNIIDIEFYDLFVQTYGKPSNMLVIENRQVESEGTFEDDNFKQHLAKSTFDLREGTFEENPLYIIWSKEDYQIKALLRHNQNTSEISFTRFTNN